METTSLDKVIINSLRINTIIGVLPWERTNPQPIRVTIIAYTKKIPGNIDDLANHLDYSKLAAEIKTLCIRVKRQTIEALAEDIASLCLQHEIVSAVCVRVEKETAIPNAQYAGVEIKRP